MSGAAPETITAQAIAAGLGVVKSTILRRADRENWPYLNGSKKARQYILADLPEQIRLRLLAHPAAAPLNEGERGGAPIIYREPVGSPDLADWQNKIALARADLIRIYLAEKDRAKAQKESVTKASNLFIKGYNTGQLLPKVFGIIGTTSRQTVDRWVKQFRDANYDYAALSPEWGNRQGQRKVTDDEFNALLSFGLHPNRLRISQVARLAKLSLRKRSIPSPSSEDTLRRSLNDWVKTHYDRWVFCREGEKALNDKCLPYLERDCGLLSVGDVLVADGHTLNFEVLHPFTGKPCRMTLVAWLDWASIYPAGWEIMPTENVQCVAAGMRRAILTIGKMPKMAYLDNGKAFKARIFTDQSIDFEEAGFYGMFARLGIDTTFAWPYNAQSKPIERFFGTFNELERLLPTYTGASISDKPAHLMRNETLHKRMHEQKYGGWAPTIAEANRIIAGWVAEYAQRPHRGLKGLCPGEVLAAGSGPGVDEIALRHLMMSMEIKQVHRNGIRFMGRNYYNEALYGLRDRVMVRYDLDDLSRVYVYDQSGSRLICDAAAIEAVHPMAVLSGRAEDLAAVREGIKLKRSLKKGTVAEARAYIKEAPALVELPAAGQAEGQRLKAEGRRGMLPQGEAEHIEAEAAKMKVLEFKAPAPDPIYMSDADRYEALLEAECRGQQLALDDLAFMRYFEKTDGYRMLRERFEFLKETWILAAGAAE